MQFMNFCAGLLRGKGHYLLELSAQPGNSRVWVSAGAQHVARRGASRGSPEGRAISQAALGGSGTERELGQKKNAFCTLS